MNNIEIIPSEIPQKITIINLKNDLCIINILNGIKVKNNKIDFKAHFGANKSFEITQLKNFYIPSNESIG